MLTRKQREDFALFEMIPMKRTWKGESTGSR
jgi:hypothetical protein